MVLSFFARPVIIFPCLALALASCGDGKPGAAGQTRAAPVVIEKAVRRDVPRTLSAVGNVQPAASVAIKPQVGGQIVAVPVASGQDVIKNQVLFQIDPRPYEAVVREMEANLLRNQVLLKKAEEDQARFSRLVKQDAISREQYDQAVANAESQSAVVVQNRAALASAKLQLEYATIRAPVSGRIGEVLLDEGNVVKANDDRALLVINTLAPAKISFAVPERYLPEVMAQFTQIDIPVTATPEGFRKIVSSGRLTSIDNAVDKTTGTIKLEATFDNKDLKLWPGQFARITVDLSTIRDALVINASAVLEGIIGQYVYIIDADNMAKARKVTARYITTTEMMVEEGLEEGERVAVDGQLSLADGVSVVERKSDGSPVGTDGGAKDAGKRP
ncbi:MAG: efflux RND transporter periplasmic adaptor subunit [Deltaproteobacteria bacterium]|jgi:multidrug efflux system membrane fusion protein|nr:efflux RND transporter periplasmic adaptor subunit [Deltaproteobacteria bacterium]